MVSKKTKAKATKANKTDAKKAAPSTTRKKLDRVLVDACGNGDVDEAREALEAGADVNACVSGQTPLVAAIEAEAEDVIELLLDQPGIDLDAPGESGATPILQAANARNAALFERLLQRGVDLTVVDDSGNSVLGEAVTYFGGEHPELVKKLLATRPPLETRDSLGRTPLYEACGLGADVARLLLEAGADPRTRTDAGETPLHAAAHWGLTEVAALLLDHGADLQARDDQGRTPLHMAIRATSFEREEKWRRCGPVLELLLDKGADLEARDDNGNTPLMDAASIDQNDTTAALLAHGARHDARDKSGATAFLQTATMAALSTARLLAEAGADLQARDASGRNAADRALAQLAGASKTLGFAELGVDDPKVRALLDKLRSSDDGKAREAYLRWLTAQGVTPSR